MIRSIESFDHLAALSDFIWENLAKPDRLDLQRIDKRISPIRRGEALTGWQFLLEGPRRLRLTAIWVVEHRQLLFYDSSGQRFRETRLIQYPDPDQLFEFSRYDSRSLMAPCV